MLNQRGSDVTINTETEDDHDVILIDWPSELESIQKVSRRSNFQGIKEQSERAINMAMNTIRAIAYRTAKTMDKLEDSVRPDEADVEFGINMDTEIGAFLARTSVGAQIVVTLKWKIEKPERIKILTNQ